MERFGVVFGRHVRERGLLLPGLACGDSQQDRQPLNGQTVAGVTTLCYLSSASSIKVYVNLLPRMFFDFLACSMTTAKSSARWKTWQPAE
jgi:hypothetical protein